MPSSISQGFEIKIGTTCNDFDESCVADVAQCFTFTIRSLWMLESIPLFTELKSPLPSNLRYKVMYLLDLMCHARILFH